MTVAPSARLPTSEEDARRRAELLVTADDLASGLTGQAPPIVLDLRYDPSKLDEDSGYEEYLRGHIPGAVYVELRSELAGPSDGINGRRPLPGRARIQAAVRRWGWAPRRRVVVYDARAGLTASRAWWVLTWAGIADVRLVDGGWGAWVHAGLPKESGDVVPAASQIDIEVGHLPHLDADQAAALAARRLLIDARDESSYSGGGKERRKGHIPGAVNLPTTGNLDEHGRFLSAPELRARFAAAGFDGSTSVGTYCGGGVSATHELIALRLAGISATLYPASWSGWSADPDRPAEFAPGVREASER
jgi:thiosulfate/3-mercaptopyruvate sulfurtransferase